MKTIFTLLFLLINTIFACEVIDLTDQSKARERSAIFDNMDNPGVRLAWSGMKEMNKRFGLGGVNAVIADYEKKLCESLKSNSFSAQVSKTDFKGYYISCSPAPGCIGELNEKISTLEPPTFPNTDIVFNTVSATAENYQEGYVKTRVVSDYPNYHPPLDKFIKDEMSESINVAKSAHPNISEIDYRKRLAEFAEVYRSEGLDQVAPEFKRLVVALDVLLETPFVGANNIENELLNALNHSGPINRHGYQVSSAITGDDLFIILKQHGEVIKVIGSDARGLGVSNMVARYIEYGNQIESRGIKSMLDIFDLSMRAIHLADEKMDESLKLYFSLVEDELAKARWSDINEMIESAHHRYHIMIEEGADHMIVRSGSIDLKSTDQAALMNQVTALHNRLKVLEKLGVTLSYGASCLAIEYTLFFSGLK